MANINEGQALKEYGNRKKRYKRRRRAIIILVILLLLVTGSVYLISLYSRNYEGYSVIKTADISGESAVGYLSYGTSVVKYSLDGAVAVDKDGDFIWNGSYEMSDPIADTCDNYVVIADRDGNSIHIFNEKGEVGTFTTDYDILKVEVAYQGVVAVLMEAEDGNYIILYDVDGTDLSTIKTSVKNDGYPMDISLSSDGQKLVTSFLSYTGGKLIDNVAFYNFGEVGQNTTDRLMGVKTFKEGNIIPRVVFVNNDIICLFKDNGFLLYSMREKQKEEHEETFEGKIQSILYNKEYVGVVLQKDGTGSKELVLYDLKGKKVLSKTLDFEYENIYLSDKEIIMYDNMSCLIMKLNGKEKFRYTFDNNIEAMYPVNNLDRYYLANGSKLLEIRLEE